MHGQFKRIINFIKNPVKLKWFSYCILLSLVLNVYNIFAFYSILEVNEFKFIAFIEVVRLLVIGMFINFIFLVLVLWNKILLNIVYIFLSIICAIALYVNDVQGIYFNSFTLLSILESDFAAVYAYVSLHMICTIIILVLLSMIPKLLVAYESYHYKYIPSIYIYIFICIMMIVSTFDVLRDFPRYLSWYPYTSYYRSLSIFKPMNVFYALDHARKVYNVNLNKSNNLMLSEAYDYVTKSNLEGVKIIFVFDESVRSDRLSLNGYTRETTPFLDSIKDQLVSFKEAYSCDTATTASFHCMMKRDTIKSWQEKDLAESSFLNILKKFGFYNLLISQHRMSKSFARYDFDKIYNGQYFPSPYDADMLDTLKTKLNNHDKEMIIFHTYSSHTPWTRFYPRDFAKYLPDNCTSVIHDCSTETRDNAYDNTVLYSDFILKEVFDIFEGNKVLFIYVSDHGIAFGEDGQFFYGYQRSVATKSMVNVPFVIYSSPEFDKQFPEMPKIKKQLQKIQNTRYVSHDNIFHTILGCVGIGSTDGGMDESLNLCNLDSIKE